MAKQIFRQVSLDRLSSPEQLDQLLTVTDSRGWLVLVALASLVVTAIVWGIYGMIPIKVAGSGILIRSGGVYDIEAEATGEITSIYHEQGAMVQKGQIIARIAQPDLVEKIREARAVITVIKEDKNRTETFVNKDTGMQKKSIAQKKKLQYQAIASIRKQITILEEQLKNQKSLFKEGLITKKSYLETKQEIENSRQKIEERRSQLQLLDIQRENLNKDTSEKVIQIDEKIAQAQRNIDTLERELERYSKVISPYTGRVLEIVAYEGTQIGRGAPILRLELTQNSSIEAVIYMQPDKGKQVKPGLEIQISPSTVKREEYGFILGLVTEVSEFPATRERMMSTLENSTLVQALSYGSAPIEVHADMIPSSKTYSGYQWSSSDGPAIRISAGTICSASVTVEKKAPVEFVIPMIKKFILGSGQ